MKTRIKKYLFLVIAMVMVVTVAVTARLSAAEPTTGSLTIICHEQKNGDTTNNPLLKGIEYTLYKVDETCEDVTEAESYVTSNSVAGTVKVTDDNGKIIYSNLALGRYYAKVTNVKEGTYNYESFIVDIPMTNTAGSGYDYDITVEPKIKTAYGNLELVKKDEIGNTLSGVTFKLQTRTINITSANDYFYGEWIDYIPEGSSESLSLTTDSDGKVIFNNIPRHYREDSEGKEEVEYRIIETSTKDDYICNNYIISNYYFSVKPDGKVEFINDTEGNGVPTYLKILQYDNNLTKIEYMNEKPDVSKKVKNREGNFIESAGLYITDTASFKITIEVPGLISTLTTFKVKDTLPAGLTLDRSSIKVEGATSDGFVTIPTDAYTLSDTGFEIAFNTENLYDQDAVMQDPLYNSIIVTYNTNFNPESTVIGGNGNVNTATLTYTNNVGSFGAELGTNTITSTAEVYTGAINIEKVEKGNVTNKLAGAKFKVATTKENAKAGVFVKDENNADIEVTTDVNGLAQIKGLAYGDYGTDVSYWLVETEAPKYKETVDGVEVEKSYNLLKNPIEVKVGKTTHNTPAQVQNSKGLNLPATGGIGIALFMIAGISIMTIAIVKNKKDKISE